MLLQVLDLLEDHFPGGHQSRFLSLGWKLRPDAPCHAENLRSQERSRYLWGAVHRFRGVLGGRHVPLQGAWKSASDG